MSDKIAHNPVGAAEGTDAQGGDVDVESELDAMRTIFAALKPLNRGTQQRVIEYVLLRLGLAGNAAVRENPSRSAPAIAAVRQLEAAASKSDDEDGLDGISPIAQRWLKRNDLDIARLSGLFSLGVDDIDVVAKSVPGKGTKEKMRAVILLRGVAAYLAGGVARFTHDQVKEACTHYDAYDGSNFATYLKSMSSEVSGTKESGYSLTTRGLSSATELVKQLTGKT